MRENDDDSGDSSAPVGDLADGLGETSARGPSGTDPYGDVYGDEGYGDGAYGEGEDDGVQIEDETDDVDDTTAPDEGDGGGLDIAATDPEPEVADPLEGIGFLLDELQDALFGEDDVDPLAAAEAEAAELEAALDPADVPTGTDLDVNGDGVVHEADLHDVVSQFDLSGDDGPHGA